jgi:hypothetical protein
LSTKTSKALQIILPLALGVFLIWYSYNKFNPEQIESIKFYFKNANYSWVILSITFALLSHFSRAYRWNYMLQPLGYKAKLPNNIMAVGIAYLMNLGIPRSGEVARALVLKKYEGTPFDKAFGTIIAERVADFIILSGLILIAVISQFATLKNFLIANFELQKILIALLVLITIGILFFVLLRRAKHPILLKLKSFLLGIKEGAFSIMHMKNKWGFIFHTLFIWLMYLLMFYVCIFALPETSHISFPVLISAFVVGSFAIAFTNGGFGTYPVAIAGILLLFDVPFEVGTAFGWIVWTSQFFMILVFGGLSFILLPIYNRKQQ